MRPSLSDPIRNPETEFDPPPAPDLKDDAHAETDSVGVSAASPIPARPPAKAGFNIRKIVGFALQRASEKKLVQVASSLTFTTVLSIVPMLAVVLALFTAFPLFGEFRAALEHFLTSSLLPPAVSDTVMQYLNLFATKASGLTAVGSLFLIVTSIMLIMTVDEAFNDIWQVERRRPFGQRMLVYWAIISLGPILAGASLWATSILARESLGYVGELPDAISFALSFVPVLLTGLGFTALFVGVPNRRVRWKDALAGGFGTAIILEIMKAGFAFYLTRFPAYTIIYGAFATLPVFLLWIYLSWLVILVGATVAAILPELRQRRWARHREPGATFVDAIGVLRALWDAQDRVPPGRTALFLCAHLHLHDDELAEVLSALKRLGYIVNTLEKDEEATSWVLACDKREATLGPVIDALLIEREQTGLARDPFLLNAVSLSLIQPDVRLEDVFNPAALPETGQMVQNRPEAPLGGRQEIKDVEG
jgi:membrane protein